jgi:hypothetical protein
MRNVPGDRERSSYTAIEGEGNDSADEGRAGKRMQLAQCPRCGSTAMTFHTLDFGVDPETGYHDQGDAYRCDECGCVVDADDFDEEEMAA